MRSPLLGSRRLVLTCSPRTALLVCVTIAVVFLLVDLGLILAVDAGLRTDSLGVKLFDTNREANLPTWFSSAVLVAAAAAFAARSSEERANGSPWRRYWAGGAAFLLLLSIDESATLHEQTVGPLIDGAKRLGLDGDVARLAAVALVCVVLAGIAVACWRWLRALDRATTRGLLLAALLFGGSALGLEVVARLYETTTGAAGLFDEFLSSFEEFGEMLGSTTFLVTALTTLASPAGESPVGDRMPDDVTEVLSTR